MQYTSLIHKSITDYKFQLTKPYIMVQLVTPTDQKLVG
jgi:hypothetical protein